MNCLYYQRPCTLNYNFRIGTAEKINLAFSYRWNLSVLSYQYCHIKVRLKHKAESECQSVHVGVGCG